MPTTIEHKKATRGHTGELARYLSNTQKIDLAWGKNGVRYSNLGLCTHIPRAIEKFLEVQEEAKRTSRDVNYHLIIAFDPHDTVTHDIFLEGEERCITQLGLKEHQRLSVIHTNTRVPHMHIQVNRVHPLQRTQEGFLRLNPLSYSQKKLKEVRRFLENKHHLTQTTRNVTSSNRRKIYRRSCYREQQPAKRDQYNEKNLGHKSIKDNPYALITEQQWVNQRELSLQKRRKIVEKLNKNKLLSARTHQLLKQKIKADEKDIRENLKTQPQHRTEKKETHISFSSTVPLHATNQGERLGQSTRTHLHQDRSQRNLSPKREERAKTTNMQTTSRMRQERQQRRSVR